MTDYKYLCDIYPSPVRGLSLESRLTNQHNVTSAYNNNVDLIAFRSMWC